MFDSLKLKLNGIIKGISQIDEKQIQKELWNLETVLLESDVALDVADKIVEITKKELVGMDKGLFDNPEKTARKSLRAALLRVLCDNVSYLDLDEFAESRAKPINILFVGVNGTGKTTTIAKIAYMLRRKGYSVVLACADTFRAGAAEQIEKHASSLDLKLIKHQYGSDPTAVVYDAVEYARARKKDVVLVDTAGRMHTNVNLMRQLEKIKRVTSPDLTIFVDEAIAGNDAVERANEFNDKINIDCSILTKIDSDAKGGSAISIAYSTGKPILFVGNGQEYGDLKKFEPEWLVNNVLG